MSSEEFFKVADAFAKRLGPIGKYGWNVLLRDPTMEFIEDRMYVGIPIVLCVIFLVLAWFTMITLVCL